MGFAVGHSIGPGLAGVLADSSGSAGIGLVIAVAALAAGALIYVGSEVPRPAGRPAR